MGSWLPFLFVLLSSSENDRFWAQIREDVETLSCHSLLEMTPEEAPKEDPLYTPQRMAFLRGWAASGKGEDKTALRAWEKAEEDPGLRPYAAERMAELLSKLDDKEAALKGYLRALEGEDLCVRFREPCLVKAGELCVELQRNEELLDVAGELSVLGSGQEKVSRLLSEAIKLSPEGASKDRLETALLRRHPDSEEARDFCLSMEGTKPSPERILRVVRVLRKHGLHQEALAFLQKLEDGLPVDMEEERLELEARVLHSLGRISEAVSLLEEYLALQEKPCPALTLLLPELLEKDGKKEKALHAYRNCLAGAEKKDFAWEAQWSRMEILTDLDRKKEARDALMEIAQKGTERWRAEALWTLCMEDLTRLNSSSPSLGPRLERLAEMGSRTVTASRACLFLAKERPEDVSVWTQKIKRLRPAGSYFYHRAADLGPWEGDWTRVVSLYIEKDKSGVGLSVISQTDQEKPEISLSSLGEGLPQPARFFWAAGLWEDAVEAMEGCGVQEAPKGKFFLLQALRRAGLYHEAIRMADRISARGRRDALWKELYPAHYETEMKASCEAYGLNHRLLWAMVREESRFYPKARSPAGALGLMQIMPGTGKWIWSKCGDRTETVDLFVPEDNLKAGAWYMDYLLNRYDGSLPLALAAYNAGPARVQRWRRTLPSGDVDLFIEGLPYLETRRYVQRVLGSYAFYCQLYPEESTLEKSFLPRKSEVSVE